MRNSLIDPFLKNSWIENCPDTRLRGTRKISKDGKMLKTIKENRPVGFFCLLALYGDHIKPRGDDLDRKTVLTTSKM